MANAELGDVLKSFGGMVRLSRLAPCNKALAGSLRENEKEREDPLATGKQKATRMYDSAP
jgi:hypothetical protein